MIPNNFIRFFFLLTFICHQTSSNASNSAEQGKPELNAPANNSKSSRGLYDPEKMLECRKKAEEVKKAKETFNGEFKRQRSQINFDIAKMEGVNLWKFGAFLENEKNREELLKVFKYLTQIKREGVDPICLTDLTLETMDKLVSVPNDAFSEIVKNSATRSEKLVEKQVKNANVKAFGDAFLFGEEGVEEILINEDGYKCAGSLLHPQSVIIFLQNIIAALENALKSGQNGNFKETINSVVEYLDNQEKQSSQEKQQKSAETQKPTQKRTVPNHSKGLKEEWSSTLETLKQKGVRKDLEDFAIWLLRPTHIDGMVQIILFITGLESAVDVSLMALDLLGIGDLFTKAMEKLGVDLEVATGIKPGVVMWAFGPNGVLPLFMRYGESDSKEKTEEYQKLVDKAGQEHKVIKMAVEHELEFLKKLSLN